MFAQVPATSNAGLNPCGFSFQFHIDLLYCRSTKTLISFFKDPGQTIISENLVDDSYSDDCKFVSEKFCARQSYERKCSKQKIETTGKCGWQMFHY